MNYGPLIFLTAFFALATSWFGFVLTPQIQIGRMLQETNVVNTAELYPPPPPGLAQQGLQVSAWDIADVALQQLQHTAAQQQLLIETQQRDILQSPPQPGSFDVIVVSYFLERSLFPIFQAALNPQGLLFYQTFTAEKCVEQGPNNPDYLLGPNELLQLCAGMRVLAYREEGRVGDCSQGLRNEAMIVAQRL